jgi:DNA-binding NarL/FixJ family response regulator
MAMNDSASGEGGIEIVLVDDSVLLRELVALSLSAIKGVAAIRQAGDVPSGLLLLEARHADALILDIEMPGQSGMDLLKIARRRNFADIIIMLSIHDHPKVSQRCMDLGANFYFHKLGELDQVAEVCRDLAERRGQQGVSSSTPHME